MARAPDFSLSARVLLQVDLEGHSAWVERSTSKPDAVRARVELAERLRRKLADHKFELLSWKGDGGVYASRPETGQGDLDFAVDAAFSVAEDFGTWRSLAGDRASLRFRISAHYAGDVYVHKDRGYWASDDLNVFIKYEREIGVSGTVAVTDVFHRNLSSAAQRKFAAFRSLHLGARPGNVGVKGVYYAPVGGEAAMNKHSRTTFFEWLSAVNLPEATSTDKLIGPSSFVRATIGDACTLFAAPHPESPMAIDFENHEPNDEIALGPDERKEWLRLDQQLTLPAQLEGGTVGNSVSASRIALPLSDIPLARVYYAVQSWNRARAFHMLLQQQNELFQRLAPHALDLLEEGTLIPGITCCHIIVRTAGSVAGRPSILWCQRQRKGHDGTYHAGRWSPTCEEQMRAGEDVHACVRRGLEEELLGSRGTVGLTVRTLGAVLERSILNLSIIVLVDVPMSFEEVVVSWRVAVDKDEHRQLAQLPIDHTIYAAMAAAGEITPDVRPLLQPSHPDVFASTSDWALHPTALVRLAFALWAQEV